MTITYPLTLPSHTGFSGLRLTRRSVVAVSTSPFTGKQQVQAHQGQWFELEGTLPPMYRADSDRWIAFLLQLNGMEGTFLAGDPAYRGPRGTITGAVVNGAHSARSKTLAIRSMTSNNPNLVTNPGFDLGDVGWTKETSWSIVNDPANAHGGSWVAKRAAYPNVSALRDGIVPCLPGEQYIAGAAIKMESGGSGGAFVRILTRDSIGAQTVVSNGNTVTSTSYGVSSARGTIPSNAVSVSAEIVGTNTAGTVYADSVVLIRQPTILAGDYIQLGSLSSARLHKVISDSIVDSSGVATLDIWPALRTSYTDGATVTIDNPVGVFRLASNEMPEDVSPGNLRSGIVIAAREAL